MGLAARNPMLGRDLVAEPFSPCEQRACDYLRAIAPDVGCGEDPVGFLIASHAVLLSEKQRAMRAVGALLPDVAIRSGGDPRLPPGRPHP